MATLEELMAQMALPDDERKRLLLGNVLLGIGGGLMSGKRGNEIGALGSGAVVGAQMGQQAIGDARKELQDKMKLQMGLQEYLAKQQASEQAAAFNRKLSEVDSNPQGGMASRSGSVADAQQIPKQWELAMRKAQMAADNGDVKRAEEYRKAAEFYRVKYGLTPQTLMRDGKPVVAQMSEYGDIKEADGYSPKPDYQKVETGKQTMFYDPLTGAQGGSFAMQTTPGQDQTAALQRAQMAQTERHWQAGQGADSKPQWDSTSGSFVYPPTVDAPQGRAVQPQGYQAKPPEHTRRELDSINAQLSTIEGARKAAEATPSAFGMTRGAATLGGSVTESLAGRMDSPDERNARSYVFNIVSAAINERAGAAQSVQELARLRSFLPGELDNSKQISDKLVAFESYLKDKRKAYGGPANHSGDNDPLGLRR